MKNYILKSILLLLTVFDLACSESDNNPSIKEFKGSARYYDTDEPMSGLALKIKFYNALPNKVLDKSQFISEFTTITDTHGTFSFVPKLPMEPGPYWAIIEVESEGLIQMEQKDPNCDDYEVQTLYVIGQEGEFNPINFYVDSAAYLQVQFNKISTTDATIVYHGNCGIDYYHANGTLTETFPTLNTTNSIERYLLYEVVGPNGIKSFHPLVKMSAGKTTLVKIEY